MFLTLYQVLHFSQTFIQDALTKSGASGTVVIA